MSMLDGLTEEKLQELAVLMYSWGIVHGQNEAHSGSETSGADKEMFVTELLQEELASPEAQS